VKKRKMEREKRESETSTWHKPPRRFQCRVCGYTFEMLPCAHGMRGKDLTCPKCGGKLKRIDNYGCDGHCSPEDCKVCGKCER